MSQFTSRVIGTGSIGSRYLRLFAVKLGSAPRAVPVGGTFRDSELSKIAILESYAQENRPVVDITVIATRTGRHVQDFESFGKVSRRVLIEKPVAPSYALGHAVMASDVAAKLAVSAPLRFMEGYQAVCDLLPFIEPIHEVSVVCQSWLPDWRPGTDYQLSYSADPDEGGVLRDLVHEIDYVLDLFGAPKSVSARLERSDELGIQAELSAMLELAYQEFNVRMNLDYTSRVARRYLSIRGESAAIRWNVLEGSVVVNDSGNSKEEILRFPDYLSKDDLLMRQVDALLAPGVDGRLCSLSEALRAVALCDAAREADAASSPLVLSGQPWG